MTTHTTTQQLAAAIELDYASAGPEADISAHPDRTETAMSQPLSGRRVLVVEDESLVAMLLEAILEDMGCTPVGPAGTVDEGLAMAAGETIDAALLDVNVAGRQVFPIAEALKARGVPFVFSTGYGEGGLSDEWRGHPTVQKPFTEAAIREALMAAMGVQNV